MTIDPASAPANPTPTCPRHPGQVAFVRCQRCNRPTCSACQRPAPVGVQCVDCVAQQAKATPRARVVLGAGLPQKPRITLGLIVTCSVVWLGQLVLPAITDQLSYVPGLTGSQPWRLITAAFVHDPSWPLHLLFNMYALWICGQYLEPLLGRVKFALLYLICALGGSVGFLTLSVWPSFSPQMWITGGVGASGAIFGLFLAVLIVNLRRGADVRALVVIIALNFVLGFMVSGIAWQTHLGGAITGALLALPLVAKRRSPALIYRSWGAVTLLLVAVAVVAATTGSQEWTQVGGLPIG
ncbi:rhomboid family intramembrane serine protease [Calidifontibacter sp. DB0510]|uniref:Rhomboid family intramembrane serine protease n=1 Tax=Metallococcus carri TaxID=1656884 RepID=A0A967EAE1_9MICO|nr:rhomboid family intramembrane serine protease [Metallococcus carri]NHN56175.1 rhomboid family intramembrane serine protease [Metallococcus carri]NOP38774.1 rhomboid family intramembrane serine protease [Calidifontibacter sp. DB2511S]